MRSDEVFTHVRLNIFPDGGVARLRVYGEVVRELEGQVDLAALENGGKALACSDMYFGVMDNLIAPGRASDMREGWETRRRRGPGEDWVLLRLAQRGVLDRMTIDTDHFKGNFPHRCTVQAALHPKLDDLTPTDAHDPDGALGGWTEIVPPTLMQADHEHRFDLPAGALSQGPWSHLRLAIFPDGGVSRLRAYGRPSAASVETDPTEGEP